MFRAIIRCPEDLARAIDWLTSNAKTDTPLELDLKDYKANRSAAQNKLMWGWYLRNLSDQLEEAGICITDDNDSEYPYCKDLLHEMFKDMYLVRSEIVRKGKTRKLYWSTADLPKSSTGGSKPSFSEYLDKIKNFSRDYWQIDLADPVSGRWKSYFEEAVKRG